MKHVEDIRALTELLLSSKNFHSLVIEGAPGWGKSTTVQNVLKEKSVSFVTLGSYTTPLRLFSFLSENPRTTVIMDDCAGIFGDIVAMSILKAATWPNSGSEGARLITWGTTSEKVEIQEFLFEGKVILLTNSVPSSGDGEAFLSRSLHYCVAPTMTDMENIIRSVASSTIFSDQGTATLVADCLIEQGRRLGFRGVNLRTLQLGYELAISGMSNWKEIFLKLLPVADPIQLAYLKSSDGNVSVEQQFKAFHQATGLSRRTFFYYRQRIRES